MKNEYKYLRNLLNILKTHLNCVTRNLISDLNELY